MNALKDLPALSKTDESPDHFSYDNFGIGKDIYLSDCKLNFGDKLEA
jgi:hypothetical protein